MADFLPTLSLNPIASATSATIDGVADGYEGFVLAQLALSGKKNQPIIFVARDSQRIGALVDTLNFVAPSLPVLQIPAWDCLPYDRVSPSTNAAARRLDALGALIGLRDNPHGAVVITTANGLLQRVAPGQELAQQLFVARPGNSVDMNELIYRLEGQGFERVGTVREVGDYAVRGGIVDLFAPGSEEPIRLDFFGDTLETIRSFDPASQRTIAQQKELVLQAMSEVTLSKDAITRFRRAYIEQFGAPRRDDALYAAISEGRRFAGMEHWLPLFYDHLDTLFDYLPDAPIVFDTLAHEAIESRFAQVLEHYDARQRSSDSKASDATPYRALKPSALYLPPKEVNQRSNGRIRVDLSSFLTPDDGEKIVIHAHARNGRSFASERADPKTNVFDGVVHHIADLRGTDKRIVVACWSAGSLDRLSQILHEHGLDNSKTVANLKELEKIPAQCVAFIVLPIETGFETDTLTVIGEQDILGDRLVRKSKRSKKASDFIADVNALAAGDIVVHADHGIGRFVGLKTIEAAGAPHDCLELRYSGDDRLFLPVENIELLSRFGSNLNEATLDKLGGVAWQSRKAKLKKRLLEMAGQLIEIAAKRELRGAPAFVPNEGLYGEFSARFPYEPTQDQQNAIDNVLDDLAKGRPMDRLICGDVGFGKTEVALRAAFVAAMEGVQVAVVVPTTLLARQHFKTFKERFSGLPLQVRQASRLVGAKELNQTKKQLSDGTVDIVIGTHALLSAATKFKDLGLLIIDEEQHFGVKHKERLKELKSDVHVLTLSATPIPRTLQLALTGVRELSLITTAPVDRMAVRTFISPFDPVVIRETLLRERYRGGQSFYVAPRVSDLKEVEQFLQEQAPELRIVVAHGQMPPGELDDIMNAFYDGKYDVLLSTTIVESGLDIPSANTLIIHRADMFGLSQLYQLRGRVGRSKLRAYALFTTPANKTLTVAAEKRLKVLQSLDTLGAGFQLASHDLDQRGAGNLLGDEQSGHIREVGFELYQQMLEEAVAQIKGEGDEESSQWSPQISIGTAVMIPEKYVPDLQLRMALYRRLSELASAQEIDGFGAELIDRFGPLPIEVKQLLKIIYIKALCRQTNVEKLDAGPKGLVIHFRNQNFANPAGLVQMIAGQGNLAKIRPDQSIFFKRDWPKAQDRLAGSAVVMVQLAKLANEG